MLWSSLVTSSIWEETKEVRILWVALLALKDRHGRVSASLPGLARTANLTVEETKNALAILTAPDPPASGADQRRVVEIPGGWQVVNHRLYHGLAQVESRREYNRERQRARREEAVSADSDI